MELLVVITIIAVLAALGFPLASRMRAGAADQKCLGQLKSWSTVIAAYSADNGGMIEPRAWNSIGNTDPSVYLSYWSGDTTHESGYRELERMRVCPSLKGSNARSGNGNSLTSYSMTDPTGSSAGKKVAPYHLSLIRVPSKFVIMIETTGGNSYISTASDFNTRVRPLTVAGTQRHKEGTVNALFADFSARPLKWKADIERNINTWTTYN